MKKNHYDQAIETFGLTGLAALLKEVQMDGKLGYNQKTEYSTKIQERIKELKYLQ